MNAVSLFTGIGGFDLGLDIAGIEVTGQVEKDLACRELLLRRFPGANLWGDIEEVTANDIRERCGPVDLVSFGWPCQDLSVAGRRAGLAGKRSGLFFEAARIIEGLRPKWILAENVPGCLSTDSGRAMDTVLGTLEELGYSIGWRVLDSQNFGVAQRRRRVFFAGHLGGPAGPLQVLFEPESLRWDPAESRKTREKIADGTLSRTVGRVGGGDDPGANKGASLIAYPEPAYCLSGGQRGRHGSGRAGQDTFIVTEKTAYNIFPESGQGADLRARPTDVSQSITVNSMERSTDRGTFVFDSTQITHPENRSNPLVGDPCHTLPASGHPPTLVRGAVRRLTPLECERLQGFPDEWTSGQPDSKRYRQLGNAVTVNVAAWLGRRIRAVETHQNS